MLVSCFQLIKTVLDEIYTQIPGPPQQKDVDIKTKLLYLSDRYRRLMDPNAIPIDYSDSATRFAYVYGYVTAHANFTYDLIQTKRVLREIFERPRVEIACIGGGPGSDFVGIFKHLLASNATFESLRCRIYDREQAWSDTWSDVDDKLGIQNIRTNFDPIDVTDLTTWSKYTKYLQSDLFTMVYFMSEVYRFKDAASPYFEHVFANARPGAIFFYLDNHNMSDWFDDLAARHGYDILEQRHQYMNLGSEEEKTDLGEYFEKYGHCPKLQASVDYRICRKPETW